jgi:DME family drug/metabolite transporter
MHSRRQAVGFSLASALLFGTSGTAQALGPAGITPIATSATRLALGAVLLVALLPALGCRIGDVSLVLRSRKAAVAAAGVCVFQAGYFTAAHTAGVALGALVSMGGIPVFTGIGGRFLGHSLTTTWLVSTTICVIGLVLLGYQGVHGGNAAGVMAAVVAAVGGAVFNLGMKHLLDQGGPAAVQQAGVFTLAAVAMALVAAATQPFGWVLTGRGAGYAVWLGLMTMALPNLLWINGLRALPPGTVATLLIAEPLTATVLGVLRLHESLTGASILGLVAVVGGLVLLTVRTGAKEPATPVG